MADMGGGTVIPFADHLGVRLVRFGEGESELVYDLQPEHTNSLDVAHGGTVMTLLDLAMGTAGRSLDSDHAMVTIEMKASFMRPGRGRLTATGKQVHRTNSFSFMQAWVHDEDGELCAHATGTFKRVMRRTT